VYAGVRAGWPIGVVMNSENSSAGQVVK
jgi:hypothetical protein